VAACRCANYAADDIPAAYCAVGSIQQGTDGHPKLPTGELMAGARLCPSAHHGLTATIRVRNPITSVGNTGQDETWTRRTVIAESVTYPVSVPVELLIFL
jgi:hypothetical protein